MVEGAGCVHHWIIESPAPGKKDLDAYCNNCDSNRTYKAVMNESFLESKLNYNRVITANGRPTRFHPDVTPEKSYE